MLLVSLHLFYLIANELQNDYYCKCLANTNNSKQIFDYV